MSSIGPASEVSGSIFVYVMVRRMEEDDLSSKTERTPEQALCFHSSSCDHRAWLKCMAKVSSSLE